MFGQTVRAYRLRLGLSQEDLAQAAGVDVKTIGNIEAGRRRPRLSTLGLLADALGLDPAEREHLRAMVAPAGPGAARAPTRVPAQLPADVPGFTGRTAELTALDALLADQEAADQPGAVVISAVSGTAGIGKTALAVHWAHRVAEQFPDGQLYVNLRGFGPDGQIMSPTEAIRGFLDALGVPPDRVPPQPDAQAALYRSLLAGSRVLVMIDNARDAAQVRPLLPGTPGCLVLVTSRSQLTGLVATGAHPLTLDVLSRKESRELLARRLGSDRVAAEPDAVHAIITACSRLPLALAIAAARAQQTGFPLAALAAELDHATGRLDALDTGEPSTQIRAVFSWSYTALTAPAARMFRLLGLHPGPDLTASAAASLAGLSHAEARRRLTELTRANLLVEHTPGRYTLHDLLRVYVTQLAQTDTADEERHAAVHRLCDHYTQTAHAAARTLDPNLDPIPVPLAPAAPGVRPEHLATRDQAMVWLATERPVVLAMLAHAADSGFHAHAWQLAWSVRRFLDRRGRWHNLAAAAQIAVHSAERLGNPSACAFAYRLLARAHTWLGRHVEAQEDLRRALDLYTSAGDVTGQAHANNDLAILNERRGNPDKAFRYAHRGLTLSVAAGHLSSQAAALNSVGWYHAQLGRYTEALAHCEQALVLLRDLGDRQVEASTWDSLGYAHLHLGHHAQAITCYQQALALFRDIGDRHNQADILTHLGDAHQRMGNPVAARQAWQQALSILADLDHPDALQVRAKLQLLSASPASGGAGRGTTGDADSAPSVPSVSLAHPPPGVES